MKTQKLRNACRNQTISSENVRDLLEIKDENLSLIENMSLAFGYGKISAIRERKDGRNGNR